MIFIVVKTEYASPWMVKHTPSGLGCGSFSYQRFARAAARDMNALVDACPDLRDPRPSNESLDDLLKTRKPHTAADVAAYTQRTGRKRTGLFGDVK